MLPKNVLLVYPSASVPSRDRSQRLVFLLLVARLPEQGKVITISCLGFLGTNFVDDNCRKP